MRGRGGGGGAPGAEGAEGAGTPATATPAARRPAVPPEAGAGAGNDPARAAAPIAR